MSFKRLRLHIKNEEGSGLVLALMTLLVLSVLGASLGAVTVGSFKLGDVNRDDTSAYYIAEAGANMAYEEMRSGVMAVHEEEQSEGAFFIKVSDVTRDVAEKINSNVDGKYSFDSQFGDTPKIKINIEEESGTNPKKYIIESTGEVAGKKRIVQKSVEVTLNKNLFPDNAAIISRGNIDFKPNAAVQGDVIVTNPNNIKLNGKTEPNPSQIDGGVFSPIRNWNDYESLANSFPDKSEFSNMLETSVINTTESDNLFFNTEILNLDNLNITGDGIVNIFVSDEIYFNGDTFNMNNDFNNIRIYFAGEKIDINKDYKFNASLFVKEGSISIGNKVSFNGVLLYGGEEEIEIGVHDELLNSYLIAPFAHVTVRNHAEIRGILIADSVDVDNQSVIHYNHIDDYPFSSIDTGTGGTDGNNEVITSEPVIESD